MQLISSTRKVLYWCLEATYCFLYHNKILCGCLGLGAFLNEKISCLLNFCLTNGGQLYSWVSGLSQDQTAMCLESWDFSVNGSLNWRHLNSINWKTQWNKIKTQDEGIHSNSLCSVDMVQVSSTVVVLFLPGLSCTPICAALSWRCTQRLCRIVQIDAEASCRC